MKIAAAQLTCVPADIAANTAQAAALAARAGDQGAELVAFPEFALTGYELESLAADPGLWITGADDPRLDPVRSAGIATAVNVALRTAGPLPAIATLVYGADGAHLTTYAKRHLYQHEQGAFHPGDTDGRFELGGIRFSLGVCYDNHFPDLTGRAAADGCRVHLAGSLYGTGDGIRERATVYPGIAREHGLYVVLANHVGPAGPWTGCGRAAVWAPGGALLAEADDRTPSVVTADIDGAAARPL
ncbi:MULTISPECIES: carbon-nitrogen hydrolase family protein [unclassified Streptomyces]|uniref:carbon-nitrogen hydrolase family protein n=1 Tax=unclassified Streptomyces TaxID=2593676 RepID=UPI00225544C6|nr:MULTISPECIES: carbon-nitrogen hydrolase family protein [unclassified Streptomyces]MCX4525719.1 carbon-nitrogen hydrolase family protein [Streptomyces sp. NBC_01551]MCX4543711.1 carbon-nitrogen hydrolase family protein [Streptomyces sp. NBC_01565]